MSTKQKVEPKPNVETQQIDDYAKLFKLDRRMVRKLKEENKKFDSKQGNEPEKGKQKQPEQPKNPLDSPAPFPGANEFNHNISEIKKLPVEERAAKYQLELTALQGLGQKLIDDKSRNDEAKKPLAADIKLAKEKINSELSADVVEIKNLKIARKKLVTDQVNAIKVKMSQVEKIGSDKGEVSQAIAEYQAAKSTLLKSLSVDMTEPNFQTADAAVKRLAAATDKVLAVNKTKRDRIAASLQTMNTLGPNLQPDEAGSFPQGSTKVIDKATDRTVVGHGPLFKPVLKALAEVEKSPVEPGLTTLEDAAKTYLADYDRRVKEGQDSGKAFKPDKITTAKADACRDAIEKGAQAPCDSRHPKGTGESAEKPAHTRRREGRQSPESEDARRKWRQQDTGRRSERRVGVVLPQGSDDEQRGVHLQAVGRRVRRRLWLGERGRRRVKSCSAPSTTR